MPAETVTPDTKRSPEQACIITVKALMDNPHLTFQEKAELLADFFAKLADPSR